jgi:hypothetical protein
MVNYLFMLRNTRRIYRFLFTIIGVLVGSIAIIWVVSAVFNTIQLIHVDDILYSKEISSDGRYIATVHMRDAGATTGFSRLVTLRANSRYFSAEQDVLALKGDAPVTLRWIDNHHLIIAYPIGQYDETGKWRFEIYHADARWRDVDITYKVLPMSKYDKDHDTPLKVTPVKD